MSPTKRISVLDHGYLQLVESWGSDERIVEAARMSTGKGFLGWGPQHSVGCPINVPLNSPKGANSTCCSGNPGDEKLLAYLYENKHATPFEMAGCVIEVQAPIFVFREWHRHRTQSYSELSSRYSPLPDVNYIPTVERLMANAGGGNRQAGTIKGADELTETGAMIFREQLHQVYGHQQQVYEDALRTGVPKELTRIHLPVGRYSRMRASANLRNWLAFLTLRMDQKAQWEIRQFAEALGTIISDLFPRTWDLFCKNLKT